MSRRVPSRDSTLSAMALRSWHMTAISARQLSSLVGIYASQAEPFQPPPASPPTESDDELYDAAAAGCFVRLGAREVASATGSARIFCLDAGVHEGVFWPGGD